MRSSFVLFVIGIYNIFCWSAQQGNVAVYTAPDLIREGAVHPDSPPLTIERFADIMETGPTKGIILFDFHGSTVGEFHEGKIGPYTVRFTEDDIPEGVYISSCRGGEGSPEHLWEGGVDLGSRGFLAPEGHILRIRKPWLFWDYRALRPYKVWWHLLTVPLFFLLLNLVYWNKEPILIGDVHARPLLVIKALLLGMLKRRKVIFAGDLLDGVKSSRDDLGLIPDWRERLVGIRSALCVKLVRICPWADTLLGNHEVYPLWFGNSPQSLAEAWGEGSCLKITARLWREWKAIEFFLTKGDLRWLRSRPIFVEGQGWTLVHAKVPLGGLAGISPYIGDEGPTLLQREVFDGTKHWKKAGPRCFEEGLVYVGHTPRQKLPDQRWDWGNLLVLDWGAKKGETAAWVVAGRKDLRAL